LTANAKSKGGRPKRPQRPYLRQLAMVREMWNEELKARRRAARDLGLPFDTKKELKKVIPGIRMSLESLRVLLSKKPTQAKVQQLIESWRALDERCADGADPFAD